MTIYKKKNYNIFFILPWFDHLLSFPFISLAKPISLAKQEKSSHVIRTSTTYHMKPSGNHTNTLCPFYPLPDCPFINTISKPYINITQTCNEHYHVRSIVVAMKNALRWEKTKRKTLYDLISHLKWQWTSPIA